MLNAILLFIVGSFQVPTDTVPFINSLEIIERAQNIKESTDLNFLEAQLQKVSSIDSNYLKCQIELMTILDQNKKTDLAIELGQRILISTESLPQNYYVSFGNLLLGIEKYDAAINIYNEGLLNFPYDQILTYNLGYTKYKQQKYEESISYMQKVLLINPFYYRAHQILGNILCFTGHRTKATLSYLAYLAIKPDQNWALVRLNDLLNDAYRQEGTYSNNLPNDDFEYYDDLLKSRAALDDRFKSKVGFEAAVAQQVELLIQKIQFNPVSEDFWMKFYVPFLAKLNQEELTTPFIYFILKSANNDEVASWLKKNDGLREKWVEHANNLYGQNKYYNERTLSGKKDIYQHWYHQNLSLNAIGKEIDEKNVGPYEFYHSSGRLSAKGTYDNFGNKIGTWFYYLENGQLSSKQNHNENGLVTGSITFYEEDGSVRNRGDYKDGELNGYYEWYSSCGQLSEKYPYQNGIGEGQGEVYYPTGEIKISYGVKEGKISGAYNIYYQSGDLKATFFKKDDLKHGAYTSYHENNLINERGNYEDDLLIGEWKRYYANGILESIGSFESGDKIGEWKYYYSNGIIKRTEQYANEYLLNGPTHWYDLDGKLYSERIFRNDTLIGYRHVNKLGENIVQETSENGNLPFLRYYANGVLYSKGQLKNGKLEGTYIIYHNNGNIYQEGTMHADQWQGKYKQYFDFGKVEISGNYVNDELDGYYVQYYPSGQINQEGWMVEGSAQQKWKFYYQNGEIKSISQYKDALLEGEQMLYGVDGKIFRKEYYKSGDLIGIEQIDSAGSVYHKVSIKKDGGSIDYLSPSGAVLIEQQLNCGENFKKLTNFYPNGQVEYVYDYNNTDVKSYQSFYPSGKVETQGSYKNGLANGRWKYLHENGKIRSDIRYTNGQKDSLRSTYYENGQLEFIANYVDGNWHGLVTYFDWEGNIQLIKFYHTEFGSYAYQYLTNESGQLSDTLEIKNRSRFTLTSYFANGKKAVSQEYNDHKLDGKVQYYSAKSQLISEKQYSVGLFHGKSVEYHSNGRVKNEQNYAYDELNGTENSFYPNGQLKETISWVYDIKHGYHKRYDEKGVLISSLFYWNNIPL